MPRWALMRGTGMKATFAAAGTRITATEFLNSSINNVTPGYFETMGMRVLAGRDFNWFDRNRTTPRKVIVNQTFARRFFPGRNPIGERFGFPGPSGVAKARQRDHRRGERREIPLASRADSAHFL